MNLAKEKERERWYSHLLQCDNIQDALQKPDLIHKLAANWKAISKNIDPSELSFQSLRPLADALFEECSKKKWFKGLDAVGEEEVWTNIVTYIAYHLWDFKRINGNIVTEPYWQLANLRHFAKKSRSFGHEAIHKAIKDNKDLLEPIEGKEDLAILPQLIQAFSQKVDELWTGESKPYALPDYDQFRTRPLINPGEEFPE